MNIEEEEYPNFQKYQNSPMINIQEENKLHGKSYLMSLGLIAYEISKIIDPLLELDLAQDTRVCLENKKKELENLRKVSTSYSQMI